MFSVPDKVADNLEKYCLRFCAKWLHESPKAAKHRIKIGNTVVVRYNERDFIDYLNQSICDEQSLWIATLAGVYDERDLPKEYLDLPYFNF